MSITEALNQLELAIKEEIGLKPSIRISIHPGDNPELSFTPAALSAAITLGRIMGKPVVPDSHNGHSWFDIGDITIFYNDKAYYDYQDLG